MTTATKKQIISICFAPPILEEFDKVRGDIPRSRYLTRLLEKDFQHQQLQRLKDLEN